MVGFWDLVGTGIGPVSKKTAVKTNPHLDLGIVDMIHEIWKACYRSLFLGFQ